MGTIKLLLFLEGARFDHDFGNIYFPVCKIEEHPTPPPPPPIALHCIALHCIKNSVYKKHKAQNRQKIRIS